MKRVRHLYLLLLTVLLPVGAAMAAGPVWPQAPAPARVRFVRQIPLADLSRHRSFLGRVGRLIGGGDDAEQLSRPFDLLVRGDQLILTCQGNDRLVVVDLADRSFRLVGCQKRPLVSPIALAVAGDEVYVSDSGSGAVYRLAGDKLEPWLTTGLLRPTGLAAVPGTELLLVVDTGDHSLKFFATDGSLVRTVGRRGEANAELNFPTFAATASASVLVNDTLNYRIKRFDGTGTLMDGFGGEGDGPGSFARPKGLAVDRDGNTWVVDALFDNIQLFDPAGKLLLVIGGPGQKSGEFWSPSGIAFDGAEAYVADTYNNRIQVLEYLGGDS